jgi:hypothetical protein
MLEMAVTVLTGVAVTAPRRHADDNDNPKHHDQDYFEFRRFSARAVHDAPFLA